MRESEDMISNIREVAYEAFNKNEDGGPRRRHDWNSKKGMNGLPSSDQVSDWTFEELCQLRLLYNGKATEYRIPTMYEAALLFAGTGSQIHFDCKVSDNINKNSDVYLLAEATGSNKPFSTITASTRWRPGSPTSVFGKGDRQGVRNRAPQEHD